MFKNDFRNMAYDFNDIVLVPEAISSINSRKEVDPHYPRTTRLPLMVSPMDSVICKNNWQDFIFHDLIPCMPRGEYVGNNIVFNSISLDEFEKYIYDLEYWRENKGHPKPKHYPLLLVDIANGHMQRLHRATSRFVELNSGTSLMIGNVANPETYRQYAKLGVDYIRCGIGGGSACLTSANTGVHYPMASLISECYKIKKEADFDTKIVADGGFRNYDDIIKALALGADYVMLGSILNKCLESCADTKIFGLPLGTGYGTFPLLRREFFWHFKSLRKYMYKAYRGMSTKEVQKKWNRETIKTAEGISKRNRVEYTLEQWTQNFEDYLRSAMSYTNSRNLEEFKECQKAFITHHAFSRFHK